MRVAGPEAALAGPSVLLVSIDTLRADHVGAYGARPDATPTLDALASEGLRFETAIASAPLTLPSHASLLTGLHPPHHGIRNNGSARLSEARTTLAERFSAAGWDTAAVVGAAVLAGRYGLDQGFDRYDDRAFGGRASETGFAERRAEAVSDAAIDWLAERDRPFFLWLHYYDPHGDYRPPPPFDRRFADRPYLGEIAYVDAQLGRVVEVLRARGALEHTLVVVTADHGESLGEHGEAGHAYTLYDAALRVPLIVRGPGVPGGTVRRGVVSTVDVAPSVLAAAGLDPLPGSDGRDLGFARTPGSDAAAGRAYAETLATQLDHGWAPLHALRTSSHLYVRAPRPELYDLAGDPAQLHDLLAVPAPAADDRRTASRLDAALETVLADASEPEPVTLDARSREQLHALGYVAADVAPPETGMDPKDGLPLLRRFVAAEGYYYLDRYDAAEAEAQALLEAWPASPRVHNLLARIDLARGRPAEALPHAEAAVRLAPDSARHREMLGATRLAGGDVEGAVADFAAAAERDPGLPEARIGLMWRLEQGGSLAQAERDAAAALAANPLDPELHLRVASTWDRLGRYERARDAYARAAELAPDRPEPRLGLALQEARLGDPERAEALLDAAGEAARAPRFQLRLAVAWAARGEPARAAPLLRELVDRHPGWSAPRALLGRVESELAGAAGS